MSISFAKRVESASRLSDTWIALSNSFAGLSREAGLPLFLGPPIDTVAKGFEHSEPIYGLKSQEIVITLSPIVAELEGIEHIEYLQHSEKLKDLEALEGLELIDEPKATKRFIEELVESDVPEDIKTLKRLVRLLRLKLHEKTLLKAFNRDPKCSWLMEILIETYFRDGEYKYAVRLAEKVLERHRNPSVLYRIARAYHRNSDEVARYYYEAARLDPEFLWAHIDLAAYYWKHENFGKAKKEAKKILSMVPEHFFAYNLLALITASKIISDGVGSSSAEDYDTANNYLENARSRNKNPEALFLGTKAHIEVAGSMLRIVNPDDAKSAIDYALRAVEDLRDHQFWQPGFAIPGFCPPRAEQLRGKLEALNSRFNTVLFAEG